MWRSENNTLVELGLSFLLCGSQGLNSGPRQQAPLSSKPFASLSQIFFSSIQFLSPHYSAHLPATTSHLDDGDRHLAGHPTLTFAHLAHFSQDNQKDHLIGQIYFLSTDLIPPHTNTT